MITNNATGKGGRRLERRYGAASCCLQGCCAVVTAAVNCRWVMAARRAAISALARPPARSGASRFGGFSSDHAVGAEALRILKPLGIDAAVTALKVETGETSAALRQLALALQQARYEATTRVDNMTRSIPGARLERGAAGRAPDRRRDHRARDKEAPAIG